MSSAIHPLTGPRTDWSRWNGNEGQTTMEYITILGMIVLATIAMLGTLMPVARICADLARRIVLDLSS